MGEAESFHLEKTSRSGEGLDTIPISKMERTSRSTPIGNSRCSFNIVKASTVDENLSLGEKTLFLGVDVPQSTMHQAGKPSLLRRSPRKTRRRRRKARGGDVEDLQSDLVNPGDTTVR